MHKKGTLVSHHTPLVASAKSKKGKLSAQKKSPETKESAKKGSGVDSSPSLVSAADLAAIARPFGRVQKKKQGNNEKTPFGGASPPSSTKQVGAGAIEASSESDRTVAEIARKINGAAQQNTAPHPQVLGSSDLTSEQALGVSTAAPAQTSATALEFPPRLFRALLEVESYIKVFGRCPFCHKLSVCSWDFSKESEYFLGLRSFPLRSWIR